MSRSRWWLLAAFVGLGLVVAACGDDRPGLARLERPGTQDQPRVIEISMVDIAFQPTAVEVVFGETIEFVFTNDGNLRHEAVFGDEAVQADHEVEMQEMTGMETGHAGSDEPDTDHADDDEIPIGDGDGHGDEGIVAVSVDPGGARAVAMTFDEPGALVIGCHVPGHWDAGMRVDITIAT